MAGGTGVLTNNDGFDVKLTNAGSFVGAVSLNGGDDIYQGEASGNVIAGDVNGGDDTIAGGGGNDFLRGGAGADSFVYNDMGDSAATSGSFDNIYDFVQGTDVIDFDLLVAGELDFTGGLAHSGGGQASVRVVYLAPSDRTSVRVDTDGNGTSDLEVRVQGVNGMTADDFIH